LESFLEV
jgi:hypothetical protein